MAINSALVKAAGIGKTINYLKEFRDTNIFISLTFSHGTSKTDVCGNEEHIDAITTQSFRAFHYNRNTSTTIPNTQAYSWKACGWAK